MAYTQDGRLISVYTPLGDEAMLLQSFSGSEGISQLFRFDLDLLCEDPAVKADDLIGKGVAVTLALYDGEARYFNGHVSRFVQGRTDQRVTHYRIEMVPWLWFLTRTADCRIFQKLSVPDILVKVFKDRGYSDFKLKLRGTYEPREYCVQYRETDFNFASRLMEEEGIAYFFEHEKDKHTLVLADEPGAHVPCPNQAKVRCEVTSGMVEEDVITAWRVEYELRPGKYTLGSFNFETPSTSLLTSVDGSGNGASKWEVYDYPVEYLKKPRGEALAKVRIQEEQAAREISIGRSTCRGLVVGYRFELEGHDRRELNQPYLITAMRHQATVGSSYTTGPEAGAAERYTNEFTCIPNSVPFRPPRVTPKPVIHGVQTAIVVGPKGEEIHTDKYARVRVQFHWDREGKRDEKSSCWIRVAQNWAGKRWGTVFPPRTGQEVIVEFLEGDPDQPIIVGRVYNAEHMPPYALPAEQTKSTIKTYSSKGGGGFNEIRFEDKKGSEQVFIHAERRQDVRVRRDSLEWVGQDRHLIVEGDQFEQVKGDKHLKAGGDHNEQIDGTLSLKVGMDSDQKVGMKMAEDAGMEIHLKGGMNVVLEGGMTVTLKAGAAFLVVGPAGVAISGTPILINSGGVAGSGSGASPEAPRSAKEADRAEPGAMEAPPPPKTTAPGPSVQAAALRAAAKHGAPFCEKCAEAARAAALARGATPDEAEQAAQEAGLAGAAAEETKTWVEFELVYEDGTPLHDEEYRIELPDGSLKRGQFDSSGRVRFDDIEPGNCTISLPKLKGRNPWRKS
jgi:type VI secretion system secreted protein VgrG